MVNANARAKAPARRVATWLAVGAAAVALALVPQLLSPYLLLLVCCVLIFALACLGLNLLLGTTGLLSLGQTVYFAIGSCAGAFPNRFANLESVKIHLLVGVLSATLLRVAFGFLCTTATRIHFTILSLALV